MDHSWKNASKELKQMTNREYEFNRMREKSQSIYDRAWQFHGLRVVQLIHNRHLVILNPDDSEWTTDIDSKISKFNDRVGY